MNVGKVPMAMQLLRSEFNLSLVAAGWLSSMFNTIALTSAVFFGMAGDRVGALRMCYVGLAVSIAAGLLALFSPDGDWLLLSRFAEGAGFVAVAVSAPALMSTASHASDRRFALGIWSAYLPAGVGLVMITTPLIVPRAGWHGLWVFTAAILAAGTLAVFLNRRHYRAPHASSGRASIREVTRSLGSPLPWLLALAMATFTAQHFALIIWLPTFLLEQRHYSVSTVSLLSFLMIIVNVPGNLIGGALVQRNVPRGTLIAWVSLVIGMCGVGMFVESLPDVVRYILCLALSGIGGIIPAAVMSASAVLARSPQQIGTLQGLFSQGGNLGQFVSPPIIAALVASTGEWHSAVYFTASAAVGGIILGLATRRYEE
jgi:MFS family permease